jgi:hypothetical protein
MILLYFCGVLISLSLVIYVLLMSLGVDFMMILMSLGVDFMMILMYLGVVIFGVIISALRKSVNPRTSQNPHSLLLRYPRPT